MDNLLILIATMLGLVCLIWVSMRNAGNFALGCFVWAFGAPWLAVYQIIIVSKLDAYSLMEWSGDATMGPITLAIVTLGVSMFFVGGRQDAKPV